MPILLPTNPTDGQTAILAGNTYVYTASTGTWDIQTNDSTPAQTEPLVALYSSTDLLPTTGNTSGDQAFVSGNNRLYIWNGTGWYNIALINTSPSITGGYNSSYLFETDGTPIVITLVGSDPEEIPLTWSYEVTSGSLTNGGGPTATVSNVNNVFTITPSTVEDYAGSFSLTFKASDGVNLGTAVSIFTLSFAIQNSNYTTLLAKGVDAKQNSTFIDSSTNNHTITANGNVYQGTFSPYRSGGYSAYFDGTDDRLEIPASSDFLFTGDFTIEGWMYWPGTVPAGPEDLISMKSGTSWFDFRWYNGSWQVSQNSGVGTSIASNSDPVADTWYHVALVRSGSTITAYINGVNGGSLTNSNTLGYETAKFTIGSDEQGANDMAGYISDVRVVNGTAVYTADFTPPTKKLSAINNTVLLTCRSSPFIDESSSAHTITPINNTSAKPFTPYDYFMYNSTTNGGSAYFELSSTLQFPGTGVADWGTGDFTVETWIYAPSGSTSQIKIIECRPGDTNGPYANFSYSPDVGLFSAYVETARRIETSTSYPSGNWYHVAYVQYNSVLTIYVNGKADGSWANTTTWSTRSDPGINIKAFSGEPNYGTVYLSNYRIVKGTAVYTADFTPPTEPLTEIPNTVLLLNFTNSGIQDYSQVNNLKLLGNTTGSNTQTKNAAYSMYFDGTGDYLAIEPSDGFKFGTGDFTVEGWIYLTGLNATANGIFQIATSSFPASTTNTVAFATENTTNFQIYAANANHSFSPAVVPSLNTWYHFAVVRSGGTTKAYINGVAGISVSDTTDYTGTYFGVGNIYGFNGYTQNGYIEDLRITKGLARYTANFTPPITELLG